MCLIDAIGFPQSAVTLYIYRVGWTYPARNLITDLNLQKILIIFEFQVDRSDRSDPPVRPVTPGL